MMAHQTRLATRRPTYGELIDLLEESEKEAPSDYVTLCAKFQQLYPHMKIARPKRFYDTVSRIAAPTKPSSRGDSKLCGSPLATYRKREWVPRVRNTADPDNVTYPESLTDYGLTEELLTLTFKQVQRGRKNLSWCLKGTPNVGFYCALHPFLKKWPLSKSTTKVAIGNYYIAIDHNLQAKGSSSYNTYRFIETLVQSGSPVSQLMTYGFESSQLKGLQQEVKQCCKKIQRLGTDASTMREKLSVSRSELRSVRNELHSALKDVTNELYDVKKQRDRAVNEVKHIQSELSDVIAIVRSELALLDDVSMIIINEEEEDFVVQTKLDGRRYSPAVRKLYYTLLAEQIPPSKIAGTIRAVLKCFFPNLDVQSIKLPEKACAGYMRREELKSVSMVHKAAVISDCAKQGMLHINTDGTTKNQKKLGAVALNGVVVSVNELPDGSAKSTIDDVSKELKKLQEVALTLGMPNASSINWTLVASSTADSAATQKKFNKLVEEKRNEDEQKFGPATSEGFDLVTNFCTMHLGINLRKAFLCGAKNSEDNDSTNGREYHPTDTLVYEFCKLFGQCGTPEYGCGGQTFPDFLQIMLNDQELSAESSQYYLICSKITLERQVGNRYFVTATNALKVLYLSEAAVSFLKYTGKDCGNKLEREIFRKLQDPEELCNLKADGLMFYHVYADLVTLAKSTELKKSAFDMNQHFFELQLFLQQLKQHPEEALLANCKVFPSEDRLYGTEKLINHRLDSSEIQKRLFAPDEWDTHLLYPILSTGAANMQEKLENYARERLPGGRFWDPDHKTKAILKELQPSNDLCESILGLNDYLTTAIPNMHQMTRSNLIEVKKNKTMQWMNHLPQEQFETVVDYAVKRRKDIVREYQEEERIRSKQRREQMVQAKRRREALQQRAKKERNELSQLHLITSPEELTQVLAEIDQSNISTSKKKAKKLDLLKTQVRIRKKVLHQRIAITFTHSRRQRPLDEIIQALSDFLAQNPTHVPDPNSIVGQRIFHKFELEETQEEHWYYGSVIGYNAVTKLHEVIYDGEEEHCHFDLTQDLILGDLRILES